MKLLLTKNIMILLAGVLLLVGCAPEKPVATTKSLTAVAFTKFPILEYHLIGRPEGRWQRTPEKFRQDLEWLYDNGYQPFDLRELLAGFSGLKPGKTPVVLTFDDSSSGQFRYLSNGQLDPDSAVGILKAMNVKHADWPLKATFFVLIETNAADHNLFGQPDYAARKLRELIDWGMEVGCHTYSHDRFDLMSSQAARRSLDRSCQLLAKLTSREVVSLSLPEGIYPQDRSLLDRFRIVAEVAGGWQTYSVKYEGKPVSVKRIQTIDSEWLKFFRRK